MAVMFGLRLKIFNNKNCGEFCAESLDKDRILENHPNGRIYTLNI